MADAVAKREARRRRILENSENRLQKITGRVSENSVEEKVTASSPLVSKLSENGLSTEEITRELINTLSEGARFLPQESNQIHEHATLSSYQQTLLLGQNLRSNLDIDGLNERLRPTIQADFNSFDNDDNLSQTSSFTKPSHTYSILFSNVSYLFLAFIINILCLLNLDHFFGKTIVAPYFAVTVARLFFPESWMEPQESSILVAALILCNINPKLVHNLRRIATMGNKIFKGFALYIFCFVIIRWVFSHFLIDLDIDLPANSVTESRFNSTI